MIVDTHTHVVGKDLRAYPLSPAGLPGTWYRDAPHTAEELLACMDAAGVDRAVLVQGVGAYSTDNRYVADSAARHPRFVGACCIDPLGEDPLAALDYWLRARALSGVRFFAVSPEAPALDDPRMLPLWERAAALGAHPIVTILAPRLAELRRVLERTPELRVSLDHCGFPSLVAEPWPEAESLFRMADLGNLHLKVTTNVIDAAGEGGAAASFVSALVSRFGAERIMWGSDFSQTHDRSYEELVQLGRAAFAHLPPGSQDECLGGTALRLWPALALASVG